jgi:predicted lysophospholipase L1 biosynthesis ABC-type transport system permease subunit
VLQGREFAPGDGPDAAPVAVVNQAFINDFWLPQALGIHVQLNGLRLDGSAHTIVGVVDETGAAALGSGAAAAPRIYLSSSQHPPTAAALAVRTSHDDPMSLLPAIEASIRAASPGARLSDAMTMADHLAGARAPLRWFAALFAVLALVALILSATGLHAVMRYNVLSRQREIGIRMALGARVRDVMRMVMVDGLRLVLAGAALGLLGAVSLVRLLQLLILGTEPLDPVLFATITMAMAAVALIASYRPAKRAASVDPQISLRAE